MDFSFSEEQQAVQGLAAQIFEARPRPRRVRGRGRRRALRDRSLGRARLLPARSAPPPARVGRRRRPWVEAPLVQEEAGRRWRPRRCGRRSSSRLPIAESGLDKLQQACGCPAWSPATSSHVGALEEFRRQRPVACPGVTAERADGGWPSRARPAVPNPNPPTASRVRGHRGGRLVASSTPPPTVVTEEATNRQIHGESPRRRGRVADAGGGRRPDWRCRVIEWLLAREVSAWPPSPSASASRRCAPPPSTHLGAPPQFGRPLSTNQGVALQAADACIDTEAVRGPPRGPRPGGSPRARPPNRRSPSLYGGPPRAATGGAQHPAPPRRHRRRHRPPAAPHLPVGLGRRATIFGGASHTWSASAPTRCGGQGRGGVSTTTSLASPTWPRATSCRPRDPQDPLVIVATPRGRTSNDLGTRVRAGVPDYQNILSTTLHHRPCGRASGVNPGRHHDHDGHGLGCRRGHEDRHHRRRRCQQATT